MFVYVYICIFQEQSFTPLEMHGLVQDCGIFTVNVLRYYSYALSHGNDLFILLSISIQIIKEVSDETIMLGLYI